MTIARFYIMHAAEGREADMLKALTDVTPTIRAVPGCEGVEVMQDLEDRRRFAFVEKWTSVEAHKGAADHLPKGALAPVMAAMEGGPDGSYLEHACVA